MHTLLTSGETIIDCGTAATIALMYAVLLRLEAECGESFGRVQFDTFFGAKEHTVPEIQRLLITNNGATSGTQVAEVVNSDGNILHFNPFSFFITPSQAAKIQNTLMWSGKSLKEIKSIVLGSLKKYTLLAFEGDPDYYNKHWSGEGGNFNGIVINLGKKQNSEISLWTFGTGIQTETQLKVAHKDFSRMISQKYMQNINITVQKKSQK